MADLAQLENELSSTQQSIATLQNDKIPEKKENLSLVELKCFEEKIEIAKLEEEVAALEARVEAQPITRHEADLLIEQTNLANKQN